MAAASPSGRSPFHSDGSDAKFFNPKKAKTHSLASIAHTLLEKGHLLSNEERATLRSLSERSKSMFSGFCGFGSVGKINNLSSSILNHKISMSEAKKEVLKLLAKQPGTDEETALANLLLSYEHELQHPVLVRETEQLKKVGRQEVAHLVDQCNATGSIQPERAGLLAFERNGHKVYYDERGALVLGSFEKKVVEPFSLSPSNERLDASKINRIKTIHMEMAQQSPYNNMGPALDFMGFLRNCHRTNPDLTMKEAFEAFQLNPAALYQRYRAGDCVLLAGALQAKLRQEGFEIGIAGQYTGPNWAQPPSQWGGPAREWKEYDAVTENVHHCGCEVRYTDLQGTEQGMYLNFWAELGNLLEEGSWEEIEQVLLTGRRDTQGNIANVEHILKMQMTGKSKMVIGSPLDPKAFLGIDMLRGNLYLTSSAAKGLEGLPLNEKEQFSLSLEALRNPDQLGTYFIDGVPTNMSHREVLQRLITLTQGRFHLPEDFSENILSFAKHSEAFFNEILLDPVPLARSFLKEVEGSKKMFGEVNDREMRYRSIDEDKLPQTTQLLIKEHTRLKSRMYKTFEMFKNAVDSNRPEEAKRLASQIEDQYQKGNLLAQQIEGQPEF